MNKAPVAPAVKEWEIGDAIEVGIEERLRVILMKVVQERNQYEATATELDHLVNVYRAAYGKAADEITRLKTLLVNSGIDPKSGDKTKPADVIPIKRGRPRQGYSPEETPGAGI